MNIQIKRLISGVLALMLVFCLAGCSLLELLDDKEFMDAVGDVASAVIEGVQEEKTPEDTPVDTEATEPEKQETEPAETTLPATEPEQTTVPAETEPAVSEDATYSSKEDVALYIHLYGHLPSNYISKKDAEDLGWPGGSLEPYAPGKCIGGSRFGNYEGLLPQAKGRTYTECDIDTMGAKSRGAKRIVFSNDGLIYYTEDHYETFELLYGEP